MANGVLKKGKSAIPPLFNGLEILSSNWTFLSVVPVFKNVRERSTAEKYRPVSLVSVVSKVIEKLANNRIVDHLERCDLFSDF